MDDTNNNSNSAPPTQATTSNVNIDDDSSQMTTPREDEVVNPEDIPTATMNNLESSSAPPEQTATPASNPSNEDDKGYDPEEISLDESMKDELLTDQEMNSDKLDTAAPSSSLPTAEQRRRDDNHLDETLDKLQHSISVAILAFRKDEQRAENMTKESGNSAGNDGSAYVKLREAAVEAHQTLVEYGSSLDLSCLAASNGDNSDAAPMNKRRREKLEKIGR